MVVVLASVGIMAQGALRTVNVLGRPFYLYEVNKGDTMYGLAHDYGWDRSTLSSWNPGELSPLHKGSVIYYPCGSDVPPAAEQPSAGVSSDNVGKEIFYTVKKGDTLFGVSRRYNVSVKAIMRHNPGVSEKNFQAGAKIKIPESGTGVERVMETVTEDRLTGFEPYKVRKEDTWASIAANHGIPVDVLKDANKGTELKKNVWVGIPLIRKVEVTREVARLDPREESSEGISAIYDDTHGVADDGMPAIRLAVVTDETSSRKDREFLRGVLLALDNIRNSGIKVDLKVIDGSHNPEGALDELAGFRPTLMISSAEKDMPLWLGEFARDNHVNLVNTLDVYNEDYLDNPYIVQLITPPAMFNTSIATWVKDNYPGYTLVFTGEEDANDAMAKSLQEVWDPMSVRSRTLDDLRNKPLAQNGKYLIYSYPTAKNDVSEFLGVVAEATAKEPLAEVKVIGRPNWIVYDGTLGEKFGENSVIVPARFFMDSRSSDVSRYTAEYREMFNNAVPGTFPAYSGVGYDVVTYFVKGLSQSNGDINGLGLSDNMLQSDYELKRPDNWSGLLNNVVYMVRYLPGNLVDKTVVR